MAMRPARKYVIVGVLCLAGLFVVLANYKQRDSYRCQTCWARKDIFQWRAGAWEELSVPLSPKWESVEETHFLHDFFPSEHVHDWKYAQGSPMYRFGTQWGGCAIGPGRHVSLFCDFYEKSPKFRTFIQAKMGDGSITTARLMALALEPGYGESSAIRREVNELIAAFFDQ